MEVAETLRQAESDVDLALVRAAKCGDTAAFHQLVQRHLQNIYRIALRITRRPEDAEEAAQDTFFRVFKNLSRFEERSRFSTWLTRIAVNTALMKLRNRRFQETVSLSDDRPQGAPLVQQVVEWRPNPEQLYSRAELRAILAKTLDSLPHTYRAVFVLRDVEGLSTAETAEVLHISTASVKTRLLRARLQLRNKLSKYFQQRSPTAQTAIAGHEELPRMPNCLMFGGAAALPSFTGRAAY